MNISDAFRGMLSAEEINRLNASIAVTERDALAGATIDTVTGLTGYIAISLVTRSTLVSVTDTKGYTLADGTYTGQRKTIRCSAVSGTPVGTITPAHATGYTTIGMDAVNEMVELQWNGAAWVAVTVVGATLS